MENHNLNDVVAEETGAFHAPNIPHLDLNFNLFIYFGTIRRRVYMLGSIN